MNPNLSIIIPVFNTEKYLAHCIDAVLNQQLQDFELILIDDGSTDESGKICDDFAKRDNRIKVRHKLNGGQSSARNMGIDLALGNYIGFVDSDDWIHENMYYKMINHAAKNNSDIVACNINVMNKNGKLSPYTSNAVNLEFNRAEAMKEIYTNRILTFSPCNKIYKRQVFEDIKFSEGVILEDMDIAYKLIYKSNKVSYLKEALYYYRYNVRSTLRSEFSIKRLDEYKIREKMYGFYRDNFPNIANSVYYDFCRNRSYLYVCVKESNLPDIKRYRYLIKYDNSVLYKVLNQNNLGLKNRIELLLLIKYPRLETEFKRCRYKLNSLVDYFRMYLQKEF